MPTPIQNVATLIIGAGLSGIHAASILAQRGEPFLVLEARERVGGRILSPEHRGYFPDLGPSWYWPEINPRINALVRELGLAAYPQYDAGYGRLQAPDGRVATISGYPMEPEGWRIEGGMISLIEGLRRSIPPQAILLKHPVCHIEKKSGACLVSVGVLGQEPRRRFLASRVFLALPPRLAAASILFTPELSHQLTQAMLGTITWMAGQAKFFALYGQAPWRRAGLSGQAFSEHGPLGEIHDGSNHSGQPFGLTGFLGFPASQRKNQEALTQAILEQLQLLYGPEAGQPEAVFYQDWAREEFTATEYDQRPVREHPLYQPPAGKTHIWDGLVWFLGTETSDELGGYLEGALASAERAAAAAPRA
ncbi:MAG: FAD-dependent oxidoreductase [Desulfarculaceae bacterium]|nr:FAD-dependent oxidoreductase [Desulfarculaceae bacterium]